MVCPNCGKPLPNKPTNYCQNCRANVSFLYHQQASQGQNQSQNNVGNSGRAAKKQASAGRNRPQNNGGNPGPAQKMKPNSKRGKKKLLLIPALVIVAAVLCVFTFSNQSSTDSSTGTGSVAITSGEFIEVSGITVTDSDDDQATDTDDPNTGGTTSDNSGSGTGTGKTLIVDALSDEETTVGSTPDKSSVQIQSPDGYAGTALDYSGPSSSGTNNIYHLTGSPDDYDVIKDYVELLTDCMNLELVDYYEKTYDSGKTFFSCALNYTGTGNVTGTSTMAFVDDGTTGNITMYGTIDGNDLNITWCVTDTLEVIDMGWRCDGTVETLTLAGESAAAGLYLLSDGSYQTSDGRLTAEINTACICLDGEEIISEAEYTITEDKEELDVANFSRTESVYFTTEYHQMLTGDIYTYEDLRDDNGTKETYNWDPHGFAMGTAFAVYHDGNWRYPEYENSYIEELTVRVMYYEEDVLAVFYIYTELVTSPNTIEILAVVDLSTAQEEEEEVSDNSDSSETETCGMCYGSGDCNVCDGKGYNWKWRAGEQVQITCGSCLGTGECSYCNGKGYK